MKFIFWILLAVNVLLLAYGQGLLGNFKGGEREPTRLVNQLERNRLVVINADQASRAAPAVDNAPPPPAPTPAPAAPTVLACVEIGGVKEADAARVDALLAPLKLGARQVREGGAAPEVTSHMVYIPSPGSKVAAEQRTAELRELGVTNYFIMSDSATMRYAISLGVFKSEAAAQTLLAALQRQGVKDARVAPRTNQVTKVTWRLRALDPQTRAKVDAIINRLPAHTLRSCK